MDLFDLKIPNISIHAPPRGATIRWTRMTVRLLISIHAPPRGATRRDVLPAADGAISIHAPPRGATVSFSGDGLLSLFQFTPLREGRPAAYSNRPLSVLFQFTPLREGRRAAGADGSHSGNFNSRPSARGDPTFPPVIAPCVIISIHAPPRGATSVGGFIFFVPPLFQFTPLREGRRAASSGRQLYPLYFNSRPSARGDWS